MSRDTTHVGGIQQAIRLPISSFWSSFCMSPRPSSVSACMPPFLGGGVVDWWRFISLYVEAGYVGTGQLDEGTGNLSQPRVNVIAWITAIT